MSKNPQKYIADKNLSDNVTRTKVSHGKIETTTRVRQANTKEELDLELQRFKILKELDKSTFGEKFVLPSSLKHWQQLILIIGTLSLKSTKEILMACIKLKYSGKLNRDRIKWFLTVSSKEYFNFDKDKGWVLTNKGQNEFSRLKQFI